MHTSQYKDGVKDELDKLLRLRIITPSTSSWASSIVAVPKTDGSVWVCIGYRAVTKWQADPNCSSCSFMAAWILITLTEALAGSGGGLLAS